MERSIVLCGRQISYELERKKVKNVNLRIRPDGSIHVSAGKSVPLGFIEDFMQAKAEYIVSALDRFTRRERELSDEAHVVLQGKRLPLTVCRGGRNFAEFVGEGVRLTLTDPEDGQLREKTLEKLRRRICEELVTELCRAAYPQFQNCGVAFPEIKFRKMKSRWGSCRPKSGVLTFSTALAQVPPACAEYVAYHEFTHFLHPDHSAAFYAALEERLPDWRERRKKLREFEGGMPFPGSRREEK